MESLCFGAQFCAARRLAQQNKNQKDETSVAPGALVCFDGVLD
jgi:hypothetical protein